MKVVLIALFVSLVGCVPVPVYKTLQPAAKMTVVDASGDPISNVEVVLVANAYPYGIEKSREARQTDMNGTAEFPARKKWRTELPLMIHGSEVFFWNWCVRKDGYLTYLTANRGRRSFDSVANIVLAKGESQVCPTGFSLKR